MTDALNPALPVGGSQVQIASELRGIKGRLVADKTAIEDLQELTEPLTTMGATGAQLLLANTPDNALDALNGTLLGKSIFNVENLAALQDIVGLQDQTENIDISGDLQKGTITWGNGFKLKFVIHEFESSTAAIIWKSPFNTVCFGAVQSWYGGDGGSDSDLKFTTAPDVNGVTSNGASGKQVFVLAIGI
jgi:hypothetical protein